MQTGNWIRVLSPCQLMVLHQSCVSQVPDVIQVVSQLRLAVLLAPTWNERIWWEIENAAWSKLNLEHMYVYREPGPWGRFAFKSNLSYYISWPALINAFDQGLGVSDSTSLFLCLRTLRACIFLMVILRHEYWDRLGVRDCIGIRKWGHRDSVSMWPTGQWHQLRLNIM